MYQYPQIVYYLQQIWSSNGPQVLTSEHLLYCEDDMNFPYKSKTVTFVQSPVVAIRFNFKKT